MDYEQTQLSNEAFYKQWLYKGEITVI